jgi:integrase
MLQKPLDRLLKIGGIDKRITPHGLRRSNVDALRRAGVDGVVEHAMVGHSSERMREHYSSVSLEERREAAERVAQAVHAKDWARELNGSPNGSPTGVERASARWKRAPSTTRRDRTAAGRPGPGL